MTARLLTILLVLVSLSAEARAAPAGTPQAFVEHLYRLYRGDRGPPSDGTVYAPPLVALMQRDAEISRRRNEVNVLDYDVLCSCQDPGGMKHSLSTVSADATTATIAVRLAFGSEIRRLTLKLVHTVQGWRIADVITPEDGSLVATLREGLANER